MIRYKVIARESRMSCVSTDERMALHYPVGAVVKKKRGSVGIFCFEHFDQAENFRNGTRSLFSKINRKIAASISDGDLEVTPDNVDFIKYMAGRTAIDYLEIIRVDPIGKGSRMRWRPITCNPDSMSKVYRLLNVYGKEIRAKADWYRSISGVPLPLCCDAPKGFPINELYSHLDYCNDGTIVYEAVRVID